jgi:delta 1-pyrroline-5-carboxylate dehydrogenase
MQYASQNLIPVSLELGGKSPNLFFDDVAAQDDAFFDKAIEGFLMFAFNQGEVCTCPSRALIQESIYDRFMERAMVRLAGIRQGDPLDPSTMIGAQASEEQQKKILKYIEIGKQEGAELLAGGAAAKMQGNLANGYYVQPTIFRGNNKMRIFQEEIFGPVLCVTTFRDEAKLWLSLTIRRTGWARESGAAMQTVAIASDGKSRPAAFGSTAITCIPPTPRSAAISNRASAAKPQDDAGSLPANQEHAG